MRTASRLQQPYSGPYRKLGLDEQVLFKIRGSLVSPLQTAAGQGWSTHQAPLFAA